MTREAPHDRVVLDACVLFPTVMREVLLGAAEQGAFRPVWSSRALEEWARAVQRRDPEDAGLVRAEIALLGARWPDARTPGDPAVLPPLRLPDSDDAHVIAAALERRAGTIVTLNRTDFPNRLLTPLGIIPREPDGFLLEVHRTGHDLTAVVLDVQRRAEEISGRAQPLRALFKRARLPRLGKALQEAIGSSSSKSL